MNNDQVEGWLDRRTRDLGKDPDFVAEGLALRFIEEISRLMDEEGITAAALAEQLGVSRAYVSKVLNAPPNLTLRSIAAVSIALKAKPFVSLLRPVTSIGMRANAAIESLAGTIPGPMPQIAYNDETQSRNVFRLSTTDGPRPRGRVAV